MRHTPHHPRGTIITYFLVLVSVLVTTLLTTMALTGGTQSQSVDRTLHRDQAFYAAEAGLQNALWHYNQSPTWRASTSAPLVGTITNGAATCTYSVTCLDAGAGVVLITSTATDSASLASSQVSATITGGGAAPGLAIGNNFADSGTLSITGTVQAKGSITRSGTMTVNNVAGMTPSDLQAMGSFTSSGTFNVPGNLELNGTITSSGKVAVAGDAQAGGAITHAGQWNVTGSTNAYDNPNLSINLPTVDTATLIAEAQADGTVIAGGAKSNLTIDFTKGPNHVVCISSNVSISGNTTVIGSGTLIVQGTMTLSGALGTVPNPISMNIVTTGNATMSGTFNLNGCLCVGGSFTKTGQTNINGIVVVGQNLTGSGNISMTYQTPPSFVHFTATGSGGGSGSGTQVLFLGPIF